MPMPISGETFPTPDWELAFDQYASNDAWYSGNQSKIQKVTQAQAGGGGARDRGDNSATHYNRSDGTRRSGGIRGFLGRFFNGRIVEPTENRTRIHAPVAENLATLSADLLTAEPPMFRIIGGDGEAIKGKVQERLDAIANSPDHARTMSHAAELTAGLGATVLTVQWDPSTTDRPWMQAAPCDAAIPEFIGNRLTAVNLYTLHLDQTDPMRLADEVYLHIERHEPGSIIHALFRVKLFEANAWGYETLGDLVPLDTHASTAHIPEIPGSKAGPVEGMVTLPTGIDRLTAAWWRNVPTKIFRKTLPFLGRADFEGIEQLLDAVDEVWSSWMIDIKIARGRLIVPETMLDLAGPGLGGSFDDAREILTPLAYLDLGAEQGRISAQQFSIRAEEHARSLLGLTREITQFAGYSLSSYGEQSQGGQGGGGITATEVTDRTTMTERTRDKKFRYFAEAMQPLTLAMLDLDRVHYRGGGEVPKGSTLDITITELSQMDPEKEARMIQYLRAAQAASTETLVRMQHPEWDNTQIRREVITIQSESGLGVDEADPGKEGRVDPNAAPSPDDENDDEGGDEDLDKETAP